MPSLDPVHGFALGVTLLTEAAGMALLAALVAPGRVLRCTLVAVVLNLLTHTLFWFGFPLLRNPTRMGLLAGEAVVVLLESAAYRLLCPFRWRLALAASLLLNLGSLVVGVQVWRLLY